MVARVFIDGEAGTTGLQIRERLAERRDIELLSIAPERRKDLGARAELLNAADVAILCLPDEAAKESVALITNDTTAVIDASTAFRVAEGWTYGFAEMDKAQSAAIAASRRVSNPGCWPQGVIAALRPLIAGGLVPADFPVAVNGISGYSGGGKSMIEDYEAKGDAANVFLPYGLAFNHKHLPEMQRYTGLAAAPLFVPSVGNYYKGMITSVPLNLARLPKVPSGAEIHAAIADHFAAQTDGFVEVAPLSPLDRASELNPQALNGTNAMRLYVFANDARAQAAIIAVYDNLGKGASGAAVQNLNILLGVAPATSLAA
ncbi:N-acetyl-gamma-glutamyl-phosphate reductase [Microvirga tunisiensis]|uniref:N-acetyl-gamma-glutamyl-phosphate reductase n=2 Tax=Pannonibacter tanglangensis TaxID=2750084 RepID=A0ABW9ZKR2_9HYPH|nr:MULTISPECIES: N-acetyl-gamma-glutamyl-phosphate reductase [unclassified Pannonibacter]NBN65515.1 N-acetyl-gamma-glutamyl-phosphate reductase [Pannonibacter sp. XCT-34]NBN80258.1 N-acetyl-gamma-glutamyl-phosphate reductase [Pannonibacter sp. XCT-53]